MVAQSKEIIDLPRNWFVTDISPPPFKMIRVLTTDGEVIPCRQIPLSPVIWYNPKRSIAPEDVIGWNSYVDRPRPTDPEKIDLKSIFGGKGSITLKSLKNNISGTFVSLEDVFGYIQAGYIDMKVYNYDDYGIVFNLMVGVFLSPFKHFNQSNDGSN